MKKTILILLLMMFIFPISYGDDIISYDLNVIIDNYELETYDEEQGIEVKPLILNNRTMVPLRTVSNAFGIPNEQIEWDSSTSTVNIRTHANDTILAQVGNDKLGFNEKKLSTDVSPQIINNRLYLPLSSISTLFDVVVEWNPDTRTVNVNPSVLVMQEYGLQFIMPVKEGFYLRNRSEESSNPKYILAKKNHTTNVIQELIMFDISNSSFDEFYYQYLIDNKLSADDFTLLPCDKRTVLRMNGENILVLVDMEERTIILDTFRFDKEMLKTLIDSIEVIE